MISITPLLTMDHRADPGVIGMIDALLTGLGTLILVASVVLLCILLYAIFSND